jgi:hypothetical protein
VLLSFLCFGCYIPISAPNLIRVDDPGQSIQLTKFIQAMIEQADEIFS